MQAKIRKVIKVSIKNRDELKKKYQCSQTAIYQALAFRTQNERAERIRQDALLNYKGVLTRVPVLN